MRIPLLLVLASLALASPVQAQLVYTEPPDLSGDVTAPTELVLSNGVNRVSGTLATPGDRQDNFTVTIPTGGMLTAMNLTLDRSGGFAGSVTWNLAEVRMTSGPFAMVPQGPGTYYVQVITDFAIGNAWEITFTVMVTGSTPVCGNGLVESGEACDDGGTADCDGCDPLCATTIDGCDVGGACVADGAISPTNPCAACIVSTSPFGYSPRPAGTDCDDTLFCTDGDACDGSGACLGSARACGDGDACTTDGCDEATMACTSTPIAGCGDAGTIETDAGTIETDAGTIESDAGIETDAGRDAMAGSDAGTPRDAGPGIDAGAAPPSSGGCGCRAGRASGSGLTLLVGLALFAARRRC